MTESIRYDRLILSLSDDELERFVHDWVSNKSYFEIQSFRGAGDRGRDVVGFLSKERHEGPWHNFQCKQYGRPVPTEIAILEVGKVLYYSFLKEFTAPTRFEFVAPSGINRNLQVLITNPTRFKTMVITEWDKYCKDNIIDKTSIPLDDNLKAFIEDWDFSAINWVGLEAMIIDDACKNVMYKWFGKDPGPPPKGSVPVDVQASEMVYVQELLFAYGERETQDFLTHTDLQPFPTHMEHFNMQRERFFDADAFSRFFRDNMYLEETQKLKHDVRHGVYDVYSSDHKDSLTKVNAVMSQAAQVSTSGILSKYSGPSVRQGICHHFVNEKEMKWKK